MDTETSEDVVLQLAPNARRYFLGEVVEHKGLTYWVRKIKGREEVPLRRLEASGR